MAKCTGNIAANIGLDCEHPITGGYEGRMILILRALFFAETSPIISTQNRRNISMPPLEIFEELASPITFNVDNAEMTNPFDGSATTGNDDGGFRKFTKTVVVRIPERGSDVSKDIIEPILRGEELIGVLEKRDMKSNGSFEIVGFYDGLRVVDPSTVYRNEDENGGSWNATLQCSEYYAECSLAQHATPQQQQPVPDYAKNKGWFDDIWYLNAGRD